MLPIFFTLSLYAADIVSFSSNGPRYKETPHTGSRDIKTSTRLYHQFFDKASKRELFRIEYGRKLEGQWVAYWSYGLIAHGDYNKDGQEDFYWSAGDDTSSEELLLLSTPTGYQRINIMASLRIAWQIRYKTPPPDFALLDSPYEIATSLESSGSSLTLIADLTGKQS